MGKSDSLANPIKFRFLISTGCPPEGHRQGPPAFIIIWLPLRVTPVTPGVHLSVLVVFVRMDAPVFPFVGEGRQLHCKFRGYIQVSSHCDPQVCSTPLWSLCEVVRKWLSGWASRGLRGRETIRYVTSFPSKILFLNVTTDSNRLVEKSFKPELSG